MQPDILWTPSPERVERATLTRYTRWLKHARGLEFDDYQALWQWSVEDLEGFWSSVVEFCDVRFEAAPSAVLASREMPGAQWFPGARLNYAKHIFRGKRSQDVAVRFASEARPSGEWTWEELRDQTAMVAARLRELGVGAGDRVAAYM